MAVWDVSYKITLSSTSFGIPSIDGVNEVVERVSQEFSESCDGLVRSDCAYNIRFKLTVN